jgi:hypothetical protein
MRIHILGSALAGLFMLFSVLPGSVSAAGLASPNSGKKAVIDTSHVRKLYQDGDFEPAIGILEEAIRNKNVPDHRDSVFVFKHLGVMYAASEHTRERGKYFMMQLLTIEPTARIMDMYASDMIYMIFRNIQEEFSQNHFVPVTAASSHEPTPVTPAEPDRPTAAPSKSGRGKIFAWAGAVAVGAGVTLYVLNNSEPEETRTNHEVK